MNLYLLHSILDRLNFFRKIRLSYLNSRMHAFTLSEKSSIFLEGSEVSNLSRKRSNIRVGHQTRIRGSLQVYPNGGNITVGDWCYIGKDSNVWSMSNISIGNRVMISHGVNIIDSTSHSKHSSQRHQHFKAMITTGHPESFEDLPGVKSSSIIIEDDVWISYGCSIFPGVIIGKGSIIASNSLVLNDVPPYTLFRNLVNEIKTPLNLN